MNRRAWPGLLLAALFCLGIVAVVEVARHQREQEAVERARKAWEPLLERAKRGR